ncbi:MAG: amidohydrolase [Anaerolineaceae bacterium 4572_78]|nr:MAG: amidohydrolase [Anaerolineaceae bacterium 4572_78]
MQDLKVTLVQTDTLWQNPKRNRDMLSRTIDKLNDPTDLVVLPEMFSTGFTIDSVANAESMDGDSIKWMHETASKYDVVISGSLIIKEQERYYNRFIWMPPDGKYISYDKRHLFRMANEHEHYVAGRKRVVVTLNGWRISPMVCYDLRFPVWCRNNNDDDDYYDVLIFVANWPAKRRYAWQTLLKARAIENLCYVVGVNRVGRDENNLDYAGDSVAINFLGEVLATCENETRLTTVNFNYEQLKNYRHDFPAHKDADQFTLRGKIVVGSYDVVLFA